MIRDAGFLLEEKYEKRRKQFREFAKQEIGPQAMEIDEQELFPGKVVGKMAEKGYLGLGINVQYKGQGQDLLTWLLCIEEISKCCAATGVILSTHGLLCCSLLETFGSGEQKEEYLKPLAKGEKLGAFALTEACAGSDIQSMETRAIYNGRDWILNGSKIFITNGGEADVYLVFAVTGVRISGKKEISAFVLEKDIPGFTVGEKAKKMGIRGSSNCPLSFHNCKIPEKNLVGNKGDGWKIAMETLNRGRTGIGAQALGIAEGAWEKAAEYAEQRKQFQHRISEFQNTRFLLAELKTQIEAARLLVYEAGRDPWQENFAMKASMAKLFATQTAMKVTQAAVQIMGGNGYLREYGVERMMRDAKVTEIYEGTNEIQRLFISGCLISPDSSNADTPCS